MQADLVFGALCFYIGSKFSRFHSRRPLDLGVERREGVLVNKNELKRLAAHAAVDYVKSGMIIGLGTGSTTEFALRRLAERCAGGEVQNIRGIASSLRTEERARELNIPLTTLDEVEAIDLAIDGADEVDAALNLIKGGGGALLREKVLFQNAGQVIVIVDSGKQSGLLGEKWPVPIEVIPFAAAPVTRFLTRLGAQVQLRRGSNGDACITDQQNWILDARFAPIADPAALADILAGRAGIVEHGLFIGLAGRLIVAGNDGIKEFLPAVLT